MIRRQHLRQGRDRAIKAAEQIKEENE